MEAGKLRSSITINQPVRSRGMSGEETVTWTPLIALFAEAQPIGGREYFSIAKRVGEELARFVIHARSDISTEMRIAQGSLTYAIREIRPSDDTTKMILIGVRV